MRHNHREHNKIVEAEKARAPSLAERTMQSMPASSDEKPTNPKDLAGNDRSPLGLVGAPFLIEHTLARMEGALKYGNHNFAVVGVRTSVYVFAMARHLFKYACGQDRDAVTGVHHLGNLSACCDVLLEATHRKILVDDRGPVTPRLDELFEHASTVMRNLIKLYGDRKPRHYTIADKGGE